ncbi:MAG: hypothetical protein C4516_05180 [Oxalobacter sp.]|nr:MAG: hypothetical protein C4516_05180 [Oxalobacter sp.]
MPETLQEKIAFLSQPSSYPDKTSSVEAIETHMSWVFLTDQFAYKLKKPVAYDYLDFSSLAARRHFCEEEVRLNRRLAANVYLGTVSLVRTHRGGMELGGRGQEVECLIRMRRLPSELSLAQCIRKGVIPQRPFDRLAEKLGLFFITSRTESISPEQYRELCTNRVVEVIGALAPKEYAMPRGVIRDVYRKLNTYLFVRGEVLDERATAGKIVEGHGDLRAEHVYLEDDPVVVDCLEFSRDLRTVDAAADLAFLALECERLGAASDGVRLLNRCFSIIGDKPPAHLIHFYQTCHACSRARLALWHLNEAQYKNDPQWREQALEWLRLAQIHSRLMGQVS